MKNIEFACKEFAEKFGITNKNINAQEDGEAIYWLEYSLQCIAKSVSLHEERLVYNEPTWGLFQAMFNRVHDYASSSFLLYFLGRYSSGEVVARTTTEAAINIYYILMENRDERLWNYLISYIQTERKQNKLWRNSISNFPEDDRRVHLMAIGDKNEVLSLYEKFIHDYFQQIGQFNISDKPWPSVFDRFRAIGKESHYRTVYSAMSSQVHNDAEDLINIFLIYSVNGDKWGESLRIENQYFCRMLIYFGLSYYIESCFIYARSFGLKEAEIELLEGWKLISNLLTSAVKKVRPELDL